MPRKLADLFTAIASFRSLCEAAHRAAKGKRSKPGAAAFLANLERNVLRLERELWEGTWRPGGYTVIEVRDPKPRRMSAAPFRDRVVHHALCAVVEPLFTRGFIDDSYPNRQGQGHTSGNCALRGLPQSVRPRLAVRYLPVLPRHRPCGAQGGSAA